MPPPASPRKISALSIDNKRRQILAVEDLDGLLSLVQAGVLEVHVRGSLIDRLELCDRIVFDIDPGEGVDWSDVVAAARDVRQRLAAIDLDSFVKLTGGKGLHVVLPIDGADWDTAKAFAQAVALSMNADSPERYVAKMTKSLRKGKIFVDYFRNSLEQTSIVALLDPGTRRRAGVGAGDMGGARTHQRRRPVHGAQSGKRLAGLKQDPWKDIGSVKQKLPDLRVSNQSDRYIRGFSKSVRLPIHTDY